MARVRIQRQTRRSAPAAVHGLAVPLETGLANVVCRHVAGGVSSMDFCADAKTPRRRTKNSAPVCTQPVPERSSKIHPGGLVPLSIYQARRVGVVEGDFDRRISASDESASGARRNSSDAALKHRVMLSRAKHL